MNNPVRRLLVHLPPSYFCLLPCLSKRRSPVLFLTSAFFLLPCLLFAAPAAGPASDNDSFLQEVTGGKAATPKELEGQVSKAVAEYAKTKNAAPLLPSLDALIQNADLTIGPQTMTSFSDALLASGDAKDLATRVPQLLEYGPTEFSPAAGDKLNLGLKLALAYGGASFDDVQKLVNVHGVDQALLLPALGRTGGAAALPLIKPYRADSSIGHGQNVSPVPYAALLGASYAGDEAAQSKILERFEEDTAELPTLAFYVSWGLTTGEKVGGAKQGVLACQNRIAQAERLLDYLGKPALPRLIARANQTGALALTVYLVKSMERAPDDQLRDYSDLMKNPATAIKERVLDRIPASGDPAWKTGVIFQLRAMLTAPAGTDRLFAVAALRKLQPAESAALVAQSLSRETNTAVRVRMEDMVPSPQR